MTIITTPQHLRTVTDIRSKLLHLQSSLLLCSGLPLTTLALRGAALYNITSSQTPLPDEPTDAVRRRDHAVAVIEFSSFNFGRKSNDRDCGQHIQQKCSRVLQQSTGPCSCFDEHHIQGDVRAPKHPPCGYEELGHCKWSRQVKTLAHRAILLPPPDGTCFQPRDEYNLHCNAGNAQTFIAPRCNLNSPLPVGPDTTCDSAENRLCG
ncbi:hypothetical protein THAOC_11601 [Thalassiosira oceanica]|uniref:CUB domain-containing protein n=1 Tax=Thalassiosira oceanica TaxID=159749 RepID=K0SPX2_THAOC|nr:hypothetical protein THAOC_11601 [Thalassiosira oceanica]|eukprot:EJK67375.1 hypothetical protein THAOC_11601 [Thalassiosira oceanica]